MTKLSPILPLHLRLSLGLHCALYSALLCALNPKIWKNAIPKLSSTFSPQTYKNVFYSILLTSVNASRHADIWTAWSCKITHSALTHNNLSQAGNCQVNFWTITDNKHIFIITHIHNHCGNWCFKKAWQDYDL